MFTCTRSVSGGLRSAERFPFELTFKTLGLLINHVLLSLDQKFQLITSHFVKLLI
jgi:hypothetical protein